MKPNDRPSQHTSYNSLLSEQPHQLPGTSSERQSQITKEKQLGMLEEIAAAWSLYNQSVSPNNLFSSQPNYLLNTEEWWDKIGIINEQIKRLAELGYPLLPNLSHHSLGKQESELNNSQVTLVHELAKNTEQLKLMLEKPRSKKQNYEIKDFYQAYLKVVNAYTKHLHQRTEFFGGHNTPLPDENKNFLKESIFEKIDFMINSFNTVWKQVTEKKASHKYWIYLLQLATFESLQGTSTKSLIRRSQREYKKLDQSSEIEFIRLYCLLRQFDKEGGSYDNIVRCIQALKDKTSKQDSCDRPQIKEKVRKLARGYDRYIRSLIDTLQVELSRLSSESSDEGPIKQESPVSFSFLRQSTQANESAPQQPFQAVSDSVPKAPAADMSLDSPLVVISNSPPTFFPSQKVKNRKKQGPAGVFAHSTNSNNTAKTQPTQTLRPLLPKSAAISQLTKEAGLPDGLPYDNSPFALQRDNPNFSTPFYKDLTEPKQASFTTVSYSQEELASYIVDAPKRLALFHKIAKAWSDYNQLQQQKVSHNILLTQISEPEIAATNIAIQRLAQYPNYPFLPPLFDLARANKASTELSNSQVAFVYALFKATAEFEAILSNPFIRENDKLEKLSNIYLSLIKIYIQYLCQHQLFFTQFNPPTLPGEKKILKENFFKIDIMIVKFSGLQRQWNQIREKENSKAFQAYLPQLTPFGQLKLLESISNKSLLQNIAAKVKELTESFEIEYVKLSSLIHYFKEEYKKPLGKEHGREKHDPKDLYKRIVECTHQLKDIVNNQDISLTYEGFTKVDDLIEQCNKTLEMKLDQPLPSLSEVIADVPIKQESSYMPGYLRDNSI